MSAAKQSHTVGNAYCAPDWQELEVLTTEGYGDKLASKTIVRSRDTAKFVDFWIEEYTGTSRRAKLCSVRLQEDAARAMYQQLHRLFGGAS